MVHFKGNLGMKCLFRKADTPKNVKTGVWKNKKTYPYPFDMENAGKIVLI